MLVFQKNASPGIPIIGLVCTKPLYCGASRETRTPDPLITNQLLYQLSYRGAKFLVKPKVKFFKYLVAKLTHLTNKIQINLMKDILRK